MLAKFASKHASDGLVAFVGFAVLFKNWGIPSSRDPFLWYGVYGLIFVLNRGVAPRIANQISRLFHD